MRVLLASAVLVVAAPVAAAPARPPAFGTCAACHATARGASAGIGPNLWGISGSKAGSHPGASPALKRTRMVWTKATLQRWLIDGQKLAPGTTMPNQSLKPADRDAIVTYLLKLK